MTLAHPTLAQQCLDEWHALTVTKSLVVLAKERGAFREDAWPNAIELSFDDDSALRITGRGQHHKVEVLLP